MNNYEIKTNGVGIKIHACIIEEVAHKQVDLIASHPAIKGLVAIMPDVHAGAGCVVGFTGQFNKSVIPNIVGVDIGCGVLTYKLDTKEIDFAKLDTFIRENIPLGFNSRGLVSPKIFEGLGTDVKEYIYEITTKAEGFLKTNSIKSKTVPLQQIGTLGGGNHFIEVEKGDNGQLYLTIHSGSRNFGLRLANYYQDMAKKLMVEMNIQVPKELEYLPYSYGGYSYLTMLKLAQDYAHYNRIVMLNTILRFLGENLNKEQMIESVHNYVSDRDHIIRKGAISAHKDEKVVIPLNMGAGIIIGTGKGNKDYNYSAPHGAGRLYGRKDMFRKLESGNFHSMEEFRNCMIGIFTTSICEETFDESPFAYKPFESIKTHLEETVNVEEMARPVYNLKSQGEG